MKKNYILLTVLFAVLIFFSGCKSGGEKTDLSDYHQCGESWSVFSGETEYDVSFVSRNDNKMRIDIEVIKSPVNIEKICVYSKGYQVIYNDELRDELLFTGIMFIPVGYYELPIEENRVSFTLLTEKEDFNGYVNVTVESFLSYNNSAVRFKVY